FEAASFCAEPLRVRDSHVENSVCVPHAAGVRPIRSRGDELLQGWGLGFGRHRGNGMERGDIFHELEADAQEANGHLRERRTDLHDIPVAAPRFGAISAGGETYRAGPGIGRQIQEVAGGARILYRETKFGEDGRVARRLLRGALFSGRAFSRAPAET